MSPSITLEYSGLTVLSCCVKSVPKWSNIYGPTSDLIWMRWQLLGDSVDSCFLHTAQCQLDLWLHNSNVAELVWMPLGGPKMGLVCKIRKQPRCNIFWYVNSSKQKRQHVLCLSFHWHPPRVLTAWLPGMNLWAFRNNLYLSTPTYECIKLYT